jgi:hypothetical protein
MIEAGAPLGSAVVAAEPREFLQRLLTSVTGQKLPRSTRMAFL